MGRQNNDAKIALLAKCAVPDFEALGVNFTKLEEDAGDSDDLVAQAKALEAISGGTGWVIRDNSKFSTAMVAHVPELPDSLMPVIVADASAAEGVHHASYRPMASTKPVIHLTKATKTYRNLTLRIVPTAASRSVFRNRASTKGRDLIDMAVRYVRSVAPAEALVVSYKTWMMMKGVDQRTIREAIDARLTRSPRHLRCPHFDQRVQTRSACADAWA